MHVVFRVFLYGFLHLQILFDHDIQNFIHRIVIIINIMSSNYHNQFIGSSSIHNFENTIQCENQKFKITNTNFACQFATSCLWYNSCTFLIFTCNIFELFLKSSIHIFSGVTEVVQIHSK